MDNLRRLDESELEIGASLPGHLRDHTGRILVVAGQVVDRNCLKKIDKHTRLGIYVGPDWPGEAPTPASLENPERPSDIVEQLRSQHQEPSKKFKERKHERHAWIVPLVVTIEEKCPGANPLRKIEVTTHNISAGGFAFTYHQYLHPGTVVHVQFDTLPNKPLLTGIIRNCILLSGRQHRVGVQFTGSLKRPSF